LPRDFYSADTIDVARALLGKRLVRRLPRGRRLSGRIVETEAYLGADDPAAHSFGGRRTARTEAMFSQPGTSYIYFIYGMYHCFNVVTAPEGTPEAVLIRALELKEGFHEAEKYTVANGPGKLCRALGLNRGQNLRDLVRDREIWIEQDLDIPDSEVIEGHRVGIGDRHDAVHWPLRFGVRGNPALSPSKFPP
jgi:DNA-3-methyladenine glycosylase